VIAHLAVCALLCGAPAKKKKAAAAPPNIQTEMSKALDAEGQKIAECVVATAPDGPWSQTVKVKIQVNNRGQLFGADVTLSKNDDKVKACVEKVLKAVTWPKHNAPLITFEREWSFNQG
jgi:hypothetical protein